MPSHQHSQPRAGPGAPVSPASATEQCPQARRDPAALLVSVGGQVTPNQPSREAACGGRARWVRDSAPGADPGAASDGAGTPVRPVRQRPPRRSSSPIDHVCTGHRSTETPVNRDAGHPAGRASGRPGHGPETPADNAEPCEAVRWCGGPVTSRASEGRHSDGKVERKRDRRRVCRPQRNHSSWSPRRARLTDRLSVRPGRYPNRLAAPRNPRLSSAWSQAHRASEGITP